MASKATRLRVIALYKELHRLGRDYPDPNYKFHEKMRGLFEKNKNLTDPEAIERAIKLGEYIRNETLALYSLRKYRHLKRMYPQDSIAEPIPEVPAPMKNA
ncbi:LYR motif-containing protein [Phanerochaete sordida]|uniref:LYR motif-containing protein n=1 Tax=Phanerochaete sordida TaxID=48140 RepID=A0A9P3LM08_9APHY|nr:LYR motif-containing protein [Phanerochaete sordida]